MYRGKKEMYRGKRKSIGNKEIYRGRRKSLGKNVSCTDEYDFCRVKFR